MSGVRAYCCVTWAYLFKHPVYFSFITELRRSQKSDRNTFPAVASSLAFFQWYVTIFPLLWCLTWSPGQNNEFHYRFMVISRDKVHLNHIINSSCEHNFYLCLYKSVSKRGLSVLTTYSCWSQLLWYHHGVMTNTPTSDTISWIVIRRFWRINCYTFPTMSTVLDIDRHPLPSS